MTETRTQARVAELEGRWESIRARLEANADTLAHRGGLVAKDSHGRRYWAVRFVTGVSGRHVHRSIYVGGDDVPELIERTRTLLAGYRHMGRCADEVEGYARMAARAGKIIHHLAAGRGRSR